MSSNKLKDDLRHPAIECPRGHIYRVSLRYFGRNVRRARDFICPKCLMAFKVKK